MGPTHHLTTDESVAEEIRTHHASMVADLDRLTGTLRDAEPDDRAGARVALMGWFEGVLVPHADEEERSTYAAAAELPEGRLLISLLWWLSKASKTARPYAAATAPSGASAQSATSRLMRTCSRTIASMVVGVVMTVVVPVLVAVRLAQDLGQ